MKLRIKTSGVEYLPAGARLLCFEQYLITCGVSATRFARMLVCWCCDNDCFAKEVSNIRAELEQCFIGSVFGFLEILQSCCSSVA